LKNYLSLNRIKKRDNVNRNEKKKYVKNMSRKIYKAISIISPLDGYILEAHMNEKDLTSA